MAKGKSQRRSGRSHDFRIHGHRKESLDKESRTQNSMAGYSGIKSAGGVSAISGLSGGEWKTDRDRLLMNVLSNPVFKYGVWAIATAVLTKLVARLTRTAPL